VRTTLVAELAASALHAAAVLTHSTIDIAHAAAYPTHAALPPQQSAQPSTACVSSDPVLLLLKFVRNNI